METLPKQLRKLRLFVAVLTVIVLACLIAIVIIARGKGNGQFDQLTALSKDNKPLIQVLDDDGQAIAAWKGKGKGATG